MMHAGFIPTQTQLSACLNNIKNNITKTEKAKSPNGKLIKLTKHWDYGPNPQKPDTALGPRTLYPRLDSDTFKNALTHIISTYDKNDANYKTALYIFLVIRNINFWLLKQVTVNGDKKIKIFYDGISLPANNCIAQFNLSAAIGQNWGLITDRTYGCKFCVNYNRCKYSSWIAVMDRDAFAQSFYCGQEYRMSFCPAILVNIFNNNLAMVICGSKSIDNKKHVGYGYVNLISKKRKRKVDQAIEGHSMIHILQENKHNIHVEFYVINNANIDMNDFTVTLESNAGNNGTSITLYGDDMKADNNYSQDENDEHDDEHNEDIDLFDDANIDTNISDDNESFVRNNSNNNNGNSNITIEQERIQQLEQQVLEQQQQLLRQQELIQDLQAQLQQQQVNNMGYGHMTQSQFNDHGIVNVNDNAVTYQQIQPQTDGSDMNSTHTTHMPNRNEILPPLPSCSVPGDTQQNIVDNEPVMNCDNDVRQFDQQEAMHDEEKELNLSEMYDDRSICDAQSVSIFKGIDQYGIDQYGMHKFDSIYNGPFHRGTNIGNWMDIDITQ